MTSPPVRAVPADAPPPELPPRSPTRFCRKPSSVGVLPVDAALPAGLRAASKAVKSLCSLSSGLLAFAVAVPAAAEAPVVPAATVDAAALPLLVPLADDFIDEMRFSSWLSRVLPLLYASFTRAWWW